MFGKFKKLMLLLMFVPMGAFISGAQDSLKLSLDEAVKLGLEQNTNIKNSKLDLQIAQKKINETIAMGLPHFDIKSAYTFLPVVPTLDFGMPGTENSGPIELGVKNNVVTDFVVSQLIFNGAYIVGVQASKIYFSYSEQNDEKTRLDVRESVINTYQMIQLGEESMKILQQNLDNVIKTQNEIKEMYNQGFTEKTDVDQLEVTANVLRNTMNQVESNLDMSYRLLKIQLGVDESVNISLSDSTKTDELLLSESLQVLNEKFVLENNIDYKLIETSKQLAILDLKREKSNYLPVISGFYSHTEKLNAPAFDFAPKDVLGLNLSLPIFTSGQRMAVVNQKKMAVEKTENTRILVSNSLLMQANQLQSDVKIKLEKYQNQKLSRDLSFDIYDRTLEKYRQGMATSMDLMNSQNQYLTNLTNYYQYMFDLQGAITKLEKLFNINQIQ